MKISNTCSYAITAVTLIASQPANSHVSNARICKVANMPERYVLQVLRTLVNEQILLSVRGVHGGYRLARLASRITLLEIVEAIDGPIGAAEPVAIQGMAKASVNAVGKALTGVAEDTRMRLAAITLTDLRAAKAA
ncbi:RrF2 family transcriptional regulator [Lacipirellula sp.]|uniref:RrF2 family transcriptional regulator n=1 Tax=Lacipirellula sp. TaxID=2691419 RepID=UPI003D0D56B5